MSLYQNHRWTGCLKGCALLLITLTLLLAGCQKNKPTHTIRFFIESPTAGHTGAWSQEITMPESGLSYYIRPQPLFTEANITNLQLARVQSGELCWIFHLDEPATRELYRRSVADSGRQIIVMVNKLPVATRHLDGPLSDGKLFTFSELPDDEMEELTIDMQDSIKKTRKMQRAKTF